MQNKVIGLISKPPHQRYSLEIRAVLPWLKKKSELLCTSNNDVLADIIRNCDYHRAYKDEVVVTQGEKGECFYIMLSGKTSIYIDTTKSDDDGEQTKNDIIETMPATEQSTADDTVEDSGDNEKQKSLDRTKYGKFMLHFEAGKSFGEIALISEDSVRNATVIADEETDLLLIHRDLFNRSMKAQQEKEYAERKEFIESCRLFSDWSTKFKHLLEMSIRKEVYPFGSHIMKQGEPVEGLFFIVSGQAKVTTEPSRHKQQYPVLTTTVSVMEKEFGIHNKENKKETNGLTQKQIRVRRKEGYAAAEKRYMSKSVDLCCVEGHEIQGDMETVMEMSTCACTVTCTADTTVFILDNKNYDRLILKRNIHTINMLKQGVMRKLHSRLATSNGGQVSLFKIIHDKLQEELKPRPKSAKKGEQTGNERNVVLSQMIKLYLKDKGPLIDPLLPDSFSSRILSEKRNRTIQKQEKKREEQGAKLRMRRRRVPRSLKQLQNSAAETELMHPNRDWLNANKARESLRPKTALGIEYAHLDGDSKSEGSYGRHGVFHLTECDTNGETRLKVAKDKPVMVTQEYDHVFQQLETIQREKSSNRSKMICSVAAKNEIRTETDRAHLGMTADEMFDMHNDDYFDYETSSMNLKNLEMRVRQFCEVVGSRRNSDPLRINGMKSFTVKDADSVPLSGATVFVNRRPCSIPRGTRMSSDVHQHVRRFIITRDNNGYPASASTVRQKPSVVNSSRPKSAW